MHGFSKAATRAIQEYSWPGNVREMEHKIQRAVIMSEEKFLAPRDLDFKEEARKGQTLRDVREDAERSFVTEVLDRTGGNISLAAKELGVSRQTLYDLLKKYKIKAVSEK